MVNVRNGVFVKRFHGIQNADGLPRASLDSPVLAWKMGLPVGGGVCRGVFPRKG